MTVRLVLWPLVMGFIGFLAVGRGSYEPLAATASGAVLGAGFGLLLAMVFLRRSARKNHKGVGA
jgi:membrane associated rhomboid family serine protease